MFVDSDIISSWRLLLVLLVVLLSFMLGTRALSAPADLQIENELLLDLRLDGERLGLDVLGYQRGNDFLISLDELSNGLGFAIVVDATQGSASGWFISEDRSFSLDIGSSTVISDGKSWPLAEGEAVMFEGGLYVETDALQRWLPLRLTAVIRELYLNVEPQDKLPIQQRLNRRERVLTSSSGYREPQLPLQDTPYQFFSPHITKLRLARSTLRETPESSAEYNTSYASLSRGDLGWMTSTLSLAGQSGDSLTGARLKLERTAFEGPLSLNHLEVGDVDAGGFRGFLLRGGGGHKDKSRRFDNESVTIEGSQLPDWDIELYQNGQLLMIQTTGPDGRYLFEDVPLSFGENRFDLKFFGPNGETESREEFHFLGADMLEPGRISYEVAAVQNGRTVLGVNDSDDITDRDSGIYTSNFNLGLSRNLTVGAGIRSEEKNGERLAFSNVGVDLTTSRAFGSIRYFDTPDAQNSVATSVRTRLGVTGLNLGYTQFIDDLDLGGSTRKWQANADITSIVFGIPIKLDFSTNEQEDLTQYSTVLGTTKSLFGLGRFSSSLFYSSVEERLERSSTTTSRAGGQSNFYKEIRPWTFRLSANYRLSPETELLDLGANSSLRIDNNLSLDLSLRKNSITDTTNYAGGINWQLDQVSINARVTYDSDERWGGLITLSTGLVHQPGTLRPRLDSRASVNAGTVEVRVFEDGDVREPQQGVSVKGTQVWRSANTDNNGVAYLTNMPAHRQVDIELDEFSLPDSELRSKSQGVSVIPRPGSYAVVEFPIVRTAELEGHIFIADGNDGMPVSRALVQLKTLDGEVVAQKRTAFDGFFLFDGIEPGTYQISLEKSLAQRILKSPENVTVQSRSGVVRGLDFTLRPAPEKMIQLNNVIQDEVTQ